MRTEKQLALIAGAIAIQKLAEGKDENETFELDAFDTDAGKLVKQKISCKDARRILLEMANVLQYDTMLKEEKENGRE